MSSLKIEKLEYLDMRSYLPPRKRCLTSFLWGCILIMAKSDTPHVEGENNETNDC
jgi:hypothetical protein